MTSGNFTFTETEIKDVYIIDMKAYGDNRGYFMETYKKSDFEAAGLHYDFVQDNQSSSRKGVLRRLHFQKAYPQAKLVRVLSSEVFDVAVDLRKGSATHGKWVGVLLSGENKRQFMIPWGFAHGFVVVSDGSNDTFEQLTREANGEYFAYCDQDDVWLPEKLTVLQELMEKNNAAIACSDMYVIDGAGKRTADSIREIRKHHIFHEGDDTARGLLFHNFVTGCTMMARAALCKAAVPFCPYMIHDYYLALYCAEHGPMAVAPRNLINYRIHGGNQTSLMMGVVDKESYYQLRIMDFLHRLEWLQEHFDCGEAMKREIADGLIWLQAREKNWRHKGGKLTIWKYRRLDVIPSLYDIFADWFPEPLFKLCVAAAKKNLI